MSIEGALNFKIQAVSCVVNVTQDVINEMEGSTILKSTKDASWGNFSKERYEAFADWVE